MKKILLSFFIFILNFYSAPSLVETVDWLNTKKNENITYASNVIGEKSPNKIQYSVEGIKLTENADLFSMIDWTDIIEVRKNEEASTNFLLVVSKFQSLSDKRSIFIEINFKDSEMRDRFSKAINNIISLKGNQLISDNLETLSDHVKWFKAKSPDVLEGSSRTRLEFGSLGMKISYLNNSASEIILWKDVKSIKSSLYEGNKNYNQFKIKTSEASTGKSSEITFHIYKYTAERYEKNLKSVCVKNGAVFVDDDLF